MRPFPNKYEVIMQAEVRMLREKLQNRNLSASKITVLVTFDSTGATPETRKHINSFLFICECILKVLLNAHITESD